MKYKLFIFDLDGTLIDSGEGIKKALYNFETRLGLNHFPKEEADFIVGPPIAESISRTHPEIADKASSLVSLFDEIYNETLLYGLVSYEGVDKILDNIHKKGGIVAIGTAKIGNQALDCLKTCGLYEKIDYLRPWQKGETKPYIMKCVMDHFDIPKEEIIAIGDSHFDGESANENKVDFIAVKYGYGFGKIESEEKFHPNYVANNTKELAQIIDSLLD